VKLIEQLVEYLRSRGALTPTQLAHLAGKGFIEAREAEPQQRHIPQEPEERDWEELYPEERPARRGRKRKARPDAAEVTPEELAARLAERFDGWQEELRGLVALAGPFGHCEDWAEAVDTLGKCSTEELSAALTVTLRSGMLSAEGLWAALQFEGYRDGLDKIPGKAGNAYRALLLGIDVAGFSKHTWLLKYDAPAAVYRLVRVQRALAQALPAVYQKTPELIRRGLGRGELTRPLALLEAAHWAGVGPDSLADQPLRFFVLVPEEEGWWPAWSLALHIDPAGVTALLGRCRIDPFVGAPEDLIPAALRRWTATAQEIEDGAAPAEAAVEAALAQLFPENGRIRPGVMAAAARHVIPSIRRRAWQHRWNVGPAGFGPLLEDAESPVREYAIRFLLESLPRNAAVQWAEQLPVLTAQLARLLEDAEPAIVIGAATALGKLGRRAALDWLRPVLDHAHPECRFAAAVALWRLGDRSPPIVPVLIQAVGEGRADELRQDCIRALGDFGPAAVPAVGLITRLLDDYRFFAPVIDTLQKLGPLAAIAVPALVGALLPRSTWYNRDWVARTLHLFRPTLLLPHLPELIGVAVSGRDEAGPVEELLRPFTEQVQTFVGQGIRALESAPEGAVLSTRLLGDAPLFAEGVPRLVGLALAEPESDAGRRAREILDRFGACAPNAIAALVRALFDPHDLGIRHMAEEVLHALYRMAAAVLSRVVEGLRDDRIEVQNTAVDILQAVGPLAAVAPALAASLAQQALHTPNPEKA
jgi:HEAT repeat protein